jgi:hypothetical protein
VTDESGAGRLLALLPEVYRTSDDGALEGFLSACSVLLDQIDATLRQRLADSFPDDTDGQDWLLPYAADLLDVALVSPHEEGRHAEVAHAVAWRQRKGTPRVAELIAEAIGGREVEIAEGWTRVAVTPRIGATVQPAATLDLRVSSRAVRAGPADLGTRLATFGATQVRWRQSEPHGVPCFLGSYEDVSRRTVDLRTPSWQHGHHHPRRLVLFLAPAAGRFSAEPAVVAWPERDAHRDDLSVTERDGTVTLRGERPGLVRLDGVNGTLELSGARDYVLERVVVHDRITVPTGRLFLRQAAAETISVQAADGIRPVLDAQDTVIGSIDAQSGLVRLEYCTVQGPLTAARVQASDCILIGPLTVLSGAGGTSCLRFTRHPELTGPTVDRVRGPGTTTDQPAFLDFTFCQSGRQFRTSTFGHPGFGVLHPATPASVRFGAEDGGEMGAYHALAICLSEQAVLDKLSGFLPVGIEAVLVPDPRLLTPPPTPKPAE